MTDAELKALGQYIKDNPNAKLYNRGIHALQRVIDNRMKIGGEGKEELISIVSTFIEEIGTDFITKIDDSMPNLSNYLRFYAKSHPYFKNISISTTFDVNGYQKALSTSLAKSLFKSMTVSGFELPIPGTTATTGISGISSVFIGIDFKGNLKEDGSVGRAVAHTAVTTVATGVGTGMLTTGIIYTSVGTGTIAAGAGWLTGIMAAHPVGWAIGAGIVVGLAGNWAYNNNVLGIKDMTNQVGDAIDDGIQSVGKAFDSGIKSIKKVFGW